MRTFGFYALLSRMKYIERWVLMRASRHENLSEHTLDTAFLAHSLCCISNTIYGGDARAETVVTASLYHDASEILTGDMPTPVKYGNAELKKAYKATEKTAQYRLVDLLPTELKPSMTGYLTGDILTDKEKLLLKAADRISAIVKCIEEEQSGNKEFIGAKKQQLESLKLMGLPEADYFIKHMLPCYFMTLDELIEE